MKEYRDDLSMNWRFLKKRHRINKNRLFPTERNVQNDVCEKKEEENLTREWKLGTNIENEAHRQKRDPQVKASFVTWFEKKRCPTLLVYRWHRHGHQHKKFGITFRVKGKPWGEGKDGGGRLRDYFGPQGSRLQLQIRRSDKSGAGKR